MSSLGTIQPSDILQLQRTIGNQTVGWLLANRNRIANDQESANGHLQQAAREGTSTPASKLPHVDEIQKSFGHHDVNVKAHLEIVSCQLMPMMNAPKFTRKNMVES